LLSATTALKTYGLEPEVIHDPFWRNRTKQRWFLATFQDVVDSRYQTIGFLPWRDSLRIVPPHR
jgi:hypothetical protein